MARLSCSDRMIAGSIHTFFFFPNILKYVRCLIKKYDFNCITDMKWIDTKDVTKLKAWQSNDGNLMIMKIIKPFLGPPHTASFWSIIIQRISHDDLTEKIFSLVSSAKLVKWQKCKTALCDMTEKLLHWTTKSSNHSGSQIHGWIFLKKKILYQFLLYFLQFKSFPPWMACFIQILMT